MNRFRFGTGLAMAVVVALGFAGQARAGGAVPFKGVLSGEFTVTVVPPIGTFVGEGTGVATHLGLFTYEFPHTVNFGVTPPAGVGTYTFTAANGDTLTATFTGTSVPVQPGYVFVTEEATITGGTGRFKNATGSFTISRLVDQVNTKTAGWFEGTITLKKKKK